MWKKILVVLMGFFAAMNFALAQVELNKADQVALDGLKGIGPAKSKAIIEERTKNGPFKDWSDFQSRVKGIGEVLSSKLSDAGLTVNGQSKSASDKAVKKTKTSSDDAKSKVAEVSKERSAAKMAEKKEASASK